jgi:hypothetical protein
VIEVAIIRWLVHGIRGMCDYDPHQVPLAFAQALIGAVMQPLEGMT